ncbi:transcriptional regulator [Streptomyces kurssanovii]|uniref:Transcriptional regulator n=1 Tax=Streptomyces kurssanovii TaxID=67312 RepID=A0ABV3HSA5_9ACTN
MTAAPTAASPMLLRLAEERATGVLVRDHGALYLADGQVVHAESPAAPGVEVLLTAGGRLAPEGWQEAVAKAGARREVARFLVDSGQVAGGEMEICHLGALHDAAFFALAPGSGPTRFRYGVAHWIGAVRPVPAVAVAREARRRRGLLDSVWPHSEVDTAPLRCRPSGHGATATPRQRALLELADGVRTPSAIARAVGRPAFNTLLEVRRMAAAGLVETPSDPAVPDPAPLPAWVADFAVDPDIALLRRLRDALEASL